MADIAIAPIYGDPEDPDRVTGFADTVSGEIIELADPDNRLVFVVAERHDAFEQEKAWERRRRIFDAILLDTRHGLGESRQVFGDLIASVRSRTYRDLDGKIFAELVYERFGEAFSQDAEAVAAVLDIIASATGYRVESREALAKRLPYLQPVAERLYRAAAPEKPTNSWIETSTARKRAP